MLQAIAKSMETESLAISFLPDHWYLLIRYANEFEIRNYVSEDPQVSQNRHRRIVTK